MTWNSFLAKNTLIYAIGVLGSRAIIFILLPLLTYVLTKDELGRYDLALTTVSLLLPIFSLQISQAVYRWILNHQENISTVLSTSLAILLINLIFCSLIYFSITITINLKEGFSLWCLLISNVILIYLQDISRGLKKTTEYSISSIISSASTFCLVIISQYVFDAGVVGVIYVTAFSHLIASVFLFLKTKIGTFFSLSNIDWLNIKELLKFSLPLIPNTISWWLISFANRYIILIKLGLEENGLYAAASQFPNILIVLNSIFLLAWQDQLITASKRKNPTFFSQVFEFYYRFQFGITAIFLAGSFLTTTIVFSIEFIEIWKLSAILYVAVMFANYGSFFGAVYLKEKNTINLFLTAVLSGLLNVLSTLFLIDFIGLYAPTIGTLLAYFLLALLRYSQTKSLLGLSVNYMLVFLNSTILFFFLLFILNIKADSIATNLFLIFISFLYFLTLNWRFLFKIFNLKA